MQHHYRLLRISGTFLLDLLRDGFGPAAVIADAIPADATIVHARAECDSLVLTLESAAFAPVSSFDPVPEITPTYRDTRANS